MAKMSKEISRNTMSRLCAVGLTLALASGAFMTGCSSQAANNAANTNAVASTAASQTFAIDLNALDLNYTDRDKDAGYDESSAVKIALNGSSANVESSASGVKVDGSTVTISKEGVYVLSGTLDGGQVLVDCAAEDKAKVQLVLNGVNITNPTGPAIRVDQAKKVFVSLPEGTQNVLSDGADYKLDDGSDEPYATVYSKDDLTIQGEGSLTVNANYRHGIVSKDDLVITGGNITVNAKEDAVRGRDCVKICGGAFDLTSGEDAVKSNNDESATAGYVSIDGGTFTINAGDDGIHAETALIINGGSVDIAGSNEGIEGQQIFINGGDINVVAKDDGVNATAGKNGDDPTAGMADRGQNHKFEIPEGASNTAPENAAPQNMGPGNRGPRPDQNTAPANQAAPQNMPAGGPGGPGGGLGGGMQNDPNVLLKIAGGTLHVNAGGDGLDSNGSLEVTGGTVFVDGPTSGGDGALDYNGTATISGGTIIAVGSAGMAESFTDGTQPFAFVYANGNAGSLIQVKDSSGNVVAEMAAEKQFATIVVSAPGLVEGSECSVVVDGRSIAMTPSVQPTERFGERGFAGNGMEGMKQRQR